MKKVILRPKRDFSVRKHHPWIFSGALADATSEGLGFGETVEVCDAMGHKELLFTPGEHYNRCVFAVLHEPRRR